MDEFTFVVFFDRRVTDRQIADRFADEFELSVSFIDLDTDEEGYRKWLKDNGASPVFGVCKGNISSKNEEYITLYGSKHSSGHIDITWKSLPDIVHGLMAATNSIAEIKFEMERMGITIFDL